MTNLLVGATFQPTEYDEHLTSLPTVAVSRVFSTSDKLPPWKDPRIQTLKKAGVIPFISVRGFNPLAFKASLDSLPADIPKVILALHHEPEGDKPPTPLVGWLSAQRALFEMVIHHPNRPRIQFVTIQTKQWTENVASRSYFSYWSGMSDAFAVDAYANTWGDPTHYPDPAAWLSKVLDFATKVDKPLWLPELGAVTRPGDTTDTGRADWIAAITNELVTSGICQLVTWWCAEGTPGTHIPGIGTTRNFHLNQRQTETGPVVLPGAPSEAVWRQFMSASQRPGGGIG